MGCVAHGRALPNGEPLNRRRFGRMPPRRPAAQRFPLPFRGPLSVWLARSAPTSAAPTRATSSGPIPTYRAAPLPNASHPQARKSLRRTAAEGARWKNDGADKPRGIYFLCLNANIAGQFELIQHSWLNNPHFGGLYAGIDPLGHVGGRRRHDHPGPAGKPAHQGLPQFVRVRGGAYFFMPGIKALEALAL